MPQDAAIPHYSLRTAQLTSANIFRDVFGDLSDDEWLTTLQRSISENVISDVTFPGFPPAALQSGLHGTSGAEALIEPFQFYKFVKSCLLETASFAPGARLLDFGCGWGRMLRPFMRDFDLSNIYAYEPDQLNCFAARTANPFVSVLTGEFFPNGRIPKNSFDLIISYSVFSHLSPDSTALWLRELAEVLRRGGHVVFTTWGLRFLDYLLSEESKMRAGEEIHWYSKHSIDKLGDLQDIRARYMGGELVWVDVGLSPLYGETFMGANAIRNLISNYHLPLELISFDKQAVPQDAFVLRRT